MHHYNILICYTRRQSFSLTSSIFLHILCFLADRILTIALMLQYCVCPCRLSVCRL